MLDRNDPAITREVTYMCSRMLSRPDNMMLWLKFDAFKVGVNSADNDYVLI